MEFAPQMLLPLPQRIDILQGTCSLRGLTRWTATGEPLPADDRSRLVAECADVLGRPLEETDAPGRGVVELALGTGVAGRGDESYALSAGPRGIRIAGATPRAIYWGLQTLRQMVEMVAHRSIPAIEIADWPTCAFRGYSDDISRRQVSTLQDFEFLVRELSHLKMNVYQPYIEDVIAIDRYPTLGLNRGRLTRDEVAWLVECGRRHYVDIMPQFNSCAHQEHMLSRPEFAAWRFEGNLETLDVTRKDVRTFLRDVYAQLFEQFPCRYFHMGLDEGRGLGHRPDLYVAHSNWLAGLVRDAGRIPVMWHDMFVPYHAHFTSYSPKLLADLDKDIVLDAWIYAPNEERIGFLDRAAEHGFSCLLSPNLGGGCCGSGTRWQWDATTWSVAHAVKNAHVLGLHNTSWNDSGQGNRHLHWRALAVNAELTWHGTGPRTNLERTTRAYGRWFHGFTSDRHADALTAAAEFGVGSQRVVRHLVTPPRALAQTASAADIKAARAATAQARRVRSTVGAARNAARRNREHIDHILGGLEALETGAARTANAPALLKALQRGDSEAVDRLMRAEGARVAAAHRTFVDLWLRREKPEGLEHADMRFRRTLSQMANLAWEMRHDARRVAALKAQGFEPLDLAGAANAPARELAALPWGETVLDNVPWRTVDPTANDGRALIWLASTAFPDHPSRVALPAGSSARAVHVLHGIFGRDAEGTDPGRYRLVHADGTRQEVLLRPTKDVGDWWMPYGHIFGGGAALRIDPARCRLAFMTDVEAFQGNALYHLRIPVDRPDAPIARIEIEAGAPDASLIVAAVTLEGTRGRA